MGSKSKYFLIGTITFFFAIIFSYLIMTSLVYPDDSNKFKNFIYFSMAILVITLVSYGILIAISKTKDIISIKKVKPSDTIVKLAETLKPGVVPESIAPIHVEHSSKSKPKPKIADSSEKFVQCSPFWGDYAMEKDRRTPRSSFNRYSNEYAEQRHRIIEKALKVTIKDPVTNEDPVKIGDPHFSDE